MLFGARGFVRRSVSTISLLRQRRPLAASLSLASRRPLPPAVALDLFVGGEARWRLFSTSISGSRARPAKGDVRRKPSDLEREQRYTGTRWQDTCSEPGCMTHPAYGLPEEGKRRWCGKPGHGPAEKENVVNKRCEEEGCKTFANYVLPGEGKKRWCSKHGHADKVRI